MLGHQGFHLCLHCGSSKCFTYRTSMEPAPVIGSGGENPREKPALSYLWLIWERILPEGSVHLLNSPSPLVLFFLSHPGPMVLFFLSHSIPLILMTLGQPFQFEVQFPFKLNLGLDNHACKLHQGHRLKLSASLICELNGPCWSGRRQVVETERGTKEEQMMTLCWSSPMECLLDEWDDF